MVVTQWLSGRVLDWLRGSLFDSQPGPCGFSLNKKICITHISVDSAENEGLVRSDKTVRMIEPQMLYAPQGVEMVHDIAGSWGGKNVKSCECLGR